MRTCPACHNPGVDVVPSNELVPTPEWTPAYKDETILSCPCGCYWHRDSDQPLIASSEETIPNWWLKFTMDTPAQKCALSIGAVTIAILNQSIPAVIIGLAYANGKEDPELRVRLMDSLPGVEQFLTIISKVSGYSCSQEGGASIAYNTGYTTLWVRIHI
jgi:hypothetical protein